ncbi:MAG: hypothetical protein ABW178_13695 [Pseudoxanthomonas sp.]
MSRYIFRSALGVLPQACPQVLQDQLLTTVQQVLGQLQQRQAIRGFSPRGLTGSCDLKGQPYVLADIDGQYGWWAEQASVLAEADLKCALYSA